jgi:hypothetical protein
MTARAAITARLDGSDHACAEGISATSPSPVLSLCRQLVAHGYDPDLPLIAVRGETVCLRVRSIGDGAQLRVGGHGIGFEAVPECGAGPSVAPNAKADRAYVEPPRKRIRRTAAQTRRKAAA